ncbi:MAG: aminotransferase class V-fold PLP-dependent enzyme [Ignavibacteriales bacterium]|jgi:cysteine desulfurase/selenocysteine lyase|nr:aminotransferase class V-fold PLP-dependent enzyme [Ignavibacteriales bacterium]MBP7542289.1 aminotransferase class V-fold PLP-dependent enzyme [Ignavibacteriaceae bacterium]MBP9123667.1 aminotransferase class V-fold PLP-dependent enzyme [Ignavibacteriaceae bacterium]
MSIEEIRELFPYLNLGKIYLNHAALSPLPQPVIDHANLFLTRRSQTSIDDMNQWAADTHEAKAKLGILLNAQPERFAFFEATATALNILAQGITWQPGDRILIDHVELPSDIMPLLNLRHYGVEIDFLPSTKTVSSTNNIIAAITPKTKLVHLNAVHYLNGYRTNLKTIGEYTSQNGIIFSVDASQAVGALQIDLEDSKIDFLSCGTQKWLFGLMGLAFIYITPELQRNITLKFNHWSTFGMHSSLLDYNLDHNNSADSLQNGTINIIGVNALIGALNMLLTYGPSKIENRIIEHTIYTIEQFHQIGIKPVCGKYKITNLSGIISFKSPKSKLIYKRLTEEKISTSLREGYVRLSHHFYNTTGELDQAIAIIKSC